LPIIIIFYLNAPAQIAGVTVLIPTWTSTWRIGVRFVKRAASCAANTVRVWQRQIIDHCVELGAISPQLIVGIDGGEQTAFLPDEIAWHDALNVDIADNRRAGVAA